MIEYKTRCTGDFWEKFRNAAPHSVVLPIQDAKSFAATILMEMMGGRCQGKFWNEVYGATQNSDVLKRYVNAVELENAYKGGDPRRIRRMEKAFAENQCPNCDVDNVMMTADVRGLINDGSLWFDQKVYLCFRAIVEMFSSCRNYGCWQHEFRMNEKEWLKGGKDEVSKIMVEAYLREIEQLGKCFEKIDFSPLKVLMGVEFDAVIAVAKSVMLENEIYRMNTTLDSITDRIQSSLAKEKILYANLRHPVRDCFSTYAETIHVEVWEIGLWRHHKVDMAVGSFLMRILR